MRTIVFAELASNTDRRFGGINPSLVKISKQRYSERYPPEINTLGLKTPEVNQAAVLRWFKSISGILVPIRLSRVPSLWLSSETRCQNAQDQCRSYTRPGESKVVAEKGS